MAWFDLENRVWTIPAHRMKAKASHRVPLTDQAVTILVARLPFRTTSNLVFASRKDTPLSDMTLTKILRDAKVASDTPGRMATVHGYSRDLAERALANTIKNAAEAAYHRTDLLDARRQMMAAWEQHLVSKVDFQTNPTE